MMSPATPQHLPHNTSSIADVYAKVLAVAPSDAVPAHTRVRLGFTSLTEEAQTFLEH